MGGFCEWYLLFGGYSVKGTSYKGGGGILCDRRTVISGYCVLKFSVFLCHNFRNYLDVKQ